MTTQPRPVAPPAGTPPSLGTTIGQLVRERPARSRLFEMLGIDYCCGGRKTLAEACEARYLDPAEVARAIAAEDQQPAPPERDWAAATLTELADHIEQTHHLSLRRELPRLAALSAKVAAAHGASHPELNEIASLFPGFAEQLTDHMIKEEQVLFPAIRALEPGPGTSPRSRPLSSPVSALVKDHDEVGAALGEFRRLTHGFEPPADACNSYRALYDGLAALERDTHLHIHLENNILFPAAVAAEAARR